MNPSAVLVDDEAHVSDVRECGSANKSLEGMRCGDKIEGNGAQVRQPPLLLYNR